MFNGTHHPHIPASIPSRANQIFASRGRKIRCDGAKPKCFHCSQRGENEQCTYDTLPKRRGPDRIQGARTRGTIHDGSPPPRRRRRRHTTVDEAASGSYGAAQPRVTPKPPMLDNLEGLVFFVHPPRQYGVRIHTLDPDFGGSSHFNVTRNQMLTVESTRTGHSVSGPLCACSLSLTSF